MAASETFEGRIWVRGEAGVDSKQGDGVGRRLGGVTRCELDAQWPRMTAHGLGQGLQSLFGKVGLAEH